MAIEVNLLYSITLSVRLTWLRTIIIKNIIKYKHLDILLNCTIKMADFAQPRNLVAIYFRTQTTLHRPTVVVLIFFIT